MQRLPRGGLSEARAASDAARRAAGRAMAAAEEANKVTKSTPQQAGLAPAEGAGTRRAAGAAQQVRERICGCVKGCWARRGASGPPVPPASWVGV